MNAPTEARQVVVCSISRRPQRPALCVADRVWHQNDPQVDLTNIKATLDELGWSGWRVIERARDATRAGDVKYNFSANAAYLKKFFQRNYAS